MTFLTLQPLSSDQLPAAVELDRRCFGGLWTLDGYRRELESPNSELLVLIEESGGRLPRASADGKPASPLLGLGCYWAILEEAHITMLAIDPAYHRQGLGQALITALMKSAHQRGLERATLEVRLSNQAALSLYQKFGFCEAGRRRHYYPDNGEDARVLWRGGLQAPEFSEHLTIWQRQVDDRLHETGWQLNIARSSSA